LHKYFKLKVQYTYKMSQLPRGQAPRYPPRFLMKKGIIIQEFI